MALVTYPLNNVEYSAEDAELFHVTRTSGIYASDSFEYSVTGADNNVVIGTGIAWIKNGEFSGKVVAQKEPVSVDLGVSDPIYPRIDVICLQFDANKNSTDIVVKTGTASSSPASPAIVRTELVYELYLYHVRREPGELTISSGNITDLRMHKEFCGLMADSVTEIDTSAIEAQIYTLINRLEEEISAVKEGSAFLSKYGDTMIGEINMSGNKITGVANPTVDTDAVNKGYMETYIDETFLGGAW